VNELAGLLNDPDKSVQRAALSSLAKWAPQAASAGPELRQMIQRTPDSAIRRQAEAVLIRVECEFREGGIVRGPKGTKAIAMVFTGHEYAEGAETVLDQLAKHRAKASCFLTGDFLRNTNFAQLVVRAAKEGHLIGPHSDKHPLYCSWEAERRTLVSEKEFNRDLADNESEINRLLPSDPASPPVAQELAMFARRYGLTRRVGAASVERAPYLLPPFEHYNRQIVEWTTARGMKLIKFTPGTRSNADYTGEADTNFVSSQAIFDSILKCEREDPHGLNGFILLFHLGSGTRRADKFHTRFGELLDVLAAKGYQFVRVDELLEPSKESQQTEARQGEK
jgi:peptidoglycan/xylan/chitin deacetylase (PgdA/CDA1 family)